MGDNPGFEELMEMLRHPRDWRVREDAVGRLSKLHTPEAMQALLSALYDAGPHVASAAAYALAKFGPEAVSGLHLALHSDSELAAPRAIVLTRGNIGDRRAVTDLIQLLSHEDAGLRSGAMMALQNMPDSRAVPHLLKLLESEDEYAKHLVAQTLGVIGDPAATPGLRALLYSSEQVTRRFAAIALGKIDDEMALEGLLEATGSEREDVRYNAAEGLGYKKDDRAFERLVFLLKDEHNLARAMAATALAKLDGTRAAPHIIKLLDDPDYTVQNFLNEALGFLPLDIVPVLMQRLRRSDLVRPGDSLYRLARSYWDSDQRGDAAIENALNGLDSENQNRRIVAAWLLVVYCAGQMYQRMEWSREGKDLSDLKRPELHEKVINACILLLDDPNPDIRLCAIKALYETPDNTAVEGLIRCLEDDDQFIVQQSSEVLARLDDERAVPGLLKLLTSQEKMSRLNAMTALGRIGGETASKALIGMLDHPDPWTRRCAAHDLADIGDKRVVPILLEKLNNETATDAREGIIFSLGRLEDKRSTPALAEILNNTSDRSWLGWRLRGTTAFALSLIRDEAALPALFEAANTAPEWQVRVQAVDALGVIGSPQEQADRLFGLLEHDNDTVRTTAAKRLGYLGAQAEDLDLRDYIVSNLINRLQDTGMGYHYSPTVAHMAAKSLYYVGTTEAIEALKNWELRQEDSQENNPE